MSRSGCEFTSQQKKRKMRVKTGERRREQDLAGYIGYRARAGDERNGREKRERGGQDRVQPGTAGYCVRGANSPSKERREDKEWKEEAMIGVIRIHRYPVRGANSLVRQG